MITIWSLSRWVAMFAKNCFCFGKSVEVTYEYEFCMIDEWDFEMLDPHVVRLIEDLGDFGTLFGESIRVDYEVDGGRLLNSEYVQRKTWEFCMEHYPLRVEEPPGLGYFLREAQPHVSDENYGYYEAICHERQWCAEFS
jgi:hypothetical protein